MLWQSLVSNVIKFQYETKLYKKGIIVMLNKYLCCKCPNCKEAVTDILTNKVFIKKTPESLIIPSCLYMYMCVCVLIHCF